MREISLLLIIIFLVGLSGCATAGSTMRKDVGYEQFYDSQGDYHLVGKSNDVYIEKLDGSESRQITHTPNMKERYAYFTKSGEYILYSFRAGEGAFIVKRGEDDSNQKTISEEEFSKLMYEKIR